MKSVIEKPHEDTPVTLAERIVIEYANISGRESDNRSFVRQAALTVLTEMLPKYIERSEVVKMVAGLGNQPMDANGFSENEIQNFQLGYSEALQDLLNSLTKL